MYESVERNESGGSQLGYILGSVIIDHDLKVCVQLLTAFGSGLGKLGPDITTFTGSNDELIILEKTAMAVLRLDQTFMKRHNMAIWTFEGNHFPCCDMLQVPYHVQLTQFSEPKLQHAVFRSQRRSSYRCHSVTV